MKKYPKYTREENKNCKLTDAQIAEVQKGYANGTKIATLAKACDVARSTIRYWVKPGVRKRVLQLTSVKNKEKQNTPEHYQRHKKYLQDKMERKRKEMLEYLGKLRKCPHCGGIINKKFINT